MLLDLEPFILQFQADSNPFIARPNRFSSVLLADLIAVIGSEVSV